MHARIEWQGDCRDDRAVFEEMLARGVHVDTSNGASGEGPFLAISVQPKAVGWSAQLELEGAGGSRESRTVEARNCGDLRRAVAWVLATFAQEVTATPAAVQDASEAKVDAQAAPVTSEPKPTSLGPDTTPTVVQRPARASLAPRDERRQAFAGSSASRFAVGVSFVSGAGWLPSVALGPSLHAEYRPLSGSGPTLSVRGARLTSLPFEREQVTLQVDRTFANVSARFPTGFRPLKLSVGVEAGVFRGAGTGAALTRAGSERRLWLAAELGAELSFALVRDVLDIEFGASGVYAPLSYSLQFGDGHGLVSSKGFEFRGVAGLVARL